MGDRFLQNIVMKPLPATLKFLLLPAIALVFGFTVRALLAEETKKCGQTEIDAIKSPVVLDFREMTVPGTSRYKFLYLCQEFSENNTSFCATYKGDDSVEHPIEPAPASATSARSRTQAGNSSDKNGGASAPTATPATLAPSPPPVIVGSHVSQRVGFANLDEAKKFLEELK